MFNLNHLRDERELTNLIFEDGKPVVQQTNGLQYYSYPVKKRGELFKKYPAIEKKLFEGLSFTEWIDWLMKKKNNNNHMKKYCKAVEKILVLKREEKC